MKVAYESPNKTPNKGLAEVIWNILVYHSGILFFIMSHLKYYGLTKWDLILYNVSKICNFVYLMALHFLLKLWNMLHFRTA